MKRRLYDRKVAIAEDTYAADFELLDRYHSFARELLRLSAGGVVAYSFALENGYLAGAGLPGGAVTAAAVLFCGSAVTSVWYLYESSDSLHYHLLRLRTTASNTEQQDLLRTQHGERLRCSASLLRWAARSFALAVLAFCGGVLVFAFR